MDGNRLPDSLNSLEDQATIDKLIQTVNNTAAYKTLDIINRNKPVGYIRGKVFSRNLILKVLVDSGNLYGDLISEELARLLKLQIFGHEKALVLQLRTVRSSCWDRPNPLEYT